MKNKPLKHKSANAFKHKSFSDRVAEIDVRKAILYHIDYRYEEEDLDENESYFAAAVTKWRALNLTDEYEEFHRGVREIATLPQLLHRKDFVIQHLLSCLGKATHLSLQPLLEFVAVLAKELQSDFCGVLPQFLDQLLKLLQSTDPDIVEWTLVCLAYLFKHLKKHLKKDIGIVLNLILPALGEASKARGQKAVEHIENFAVECFAYVARDIRDREHFVRTVVEFVQRNNGVSVSCGQLFFQIVRGVQGGLHSCTEDFLIVVLDALYTSGEELEILSSLLNEMIDNFHNIITVDKNEVLWRVFMKFLERILAAKEVPACVTCAVDVVGKLVLHHSGIFVKNPQELCQVAIKFIEKDFQDIETNDSVHLAVSRLTEYLLMKSNVNLPLHHATNLIRKILSTVNFCVLKDFVECSMKNPQFDSLIFPHVLEQILRFGITDETLHLLGLVLEEKSRRDGVTYANWKSCEITMKSADFSEKVEEILLTHTPDEDIFFLALISWAHLAGINRNNVEEKLIRDIQRLEGSLTTPRGTWKYFQILKVLIHYQSRLIDPLDVTEKVLEVINGVWRDYEEKLNALWFVDLCIIAMKRHDQSRLTYKLFERLHESYSKLLCSPSHEVRLVVSHTLAQFNHLKEFQSPEPFLFEIIHTVESTPSTIQTYREQLLHLQKVSYGTMYFKEAIGKHEILQWDALKYLLGVLYINFKLLWEPTVEYIASYALRSDRKMFWQIYREQLESIDQHLRQNLAENKDFIEELLPGLETFRPETGRNFKNKPDFINYRILLWKALPQFGDLLQEKNRDLVTYFLKFYEKVYRVYVLEHSTGKIDIRAEEKDQEMAEQEENVEENDSLESEDEENELPEKDESTTKVLEEEDEELEDKIDPLVTKAIHKELTTYLQVFATLPNPKFVFKEKELHAIYLHLLSSKNPDVQKIALDCLLAYKPKNLSSHAEVLRNFVDEKKFKEAMGSFVINLEQKEQELSLIGENRPHVMHYLLRILHGKMFTRQQQQRGQPQTRKMLIVRYLSGCSVEELNEFLDMIFGETSGIPRLIPADLTNATHPRHIQSSLSLIDLMLGEFGGIRSDEIRRRLLYLILQQSATIQGIFTAAENRPIRYLNLLKNIRTEAANLIRKFFNLFEAFSWQEDEIEAIFDIFVWPQLPKLPMECIHSPTALLRLFLAWSTNPRYFVLLSKIPEELSEENPLKAVFDLLKRPRINGKVTDAAMDIISNLLSLDDDALVTEDSPKAPEILIKNPRIPESEPERNLSVGRRLILPHIDAIVNRLQSRMSGQKKKAVGKRDLAILSRIADLITDKEKSEILVGLLLPILTRKTGRMLNESSMVQMITSLTNLVDKSETPGRHIRTLAPLFEEISSLACRKLLCDLVVRIAKKSEDEMVSELVVELNALNRRWIDQPDFDRRLTAFRTIDDLIEKDRINVNVGLVAIFHSFFFLRHEKDLAMRSSSSHCLRKVSLALARKYSEEPEERKYIFDGVLLPLIKRSISGNNENLRAECVRILGDLSRVHPEVHYVFGDLHCLTDKHDKEVDFFENIIHLQQHRQGRALARFIRSAPQMKDPNPKTLLDFMLPLVSSYLCNEKFISKNSTVDFAAEAISVICKKLPFLPYQNILRLFIRKLRMNVEYQKQMVKVVIAIIDAFHFDFSEKKVKVENKNGNQEADESDEEDTEDLQEVKKESKKILKTSSGTNSPEYNLMVGLISSLIGTIAEFSTKEANHKLTKAQNAAQKEEEDILRIPIGVATVQLLHKVSKELLDTHLPKILMKLCTFLKSRLKSVRIVTRDMLKKIMEILGPGYLKILLDSLTSILTRGYQVHVLVVTLHGILDRLKGNFKAGDIDDNLQCILKICMENVFGESAEEREVEKIAAKTHEAKFSNKSLLILQILATNINEKCLLDILLPFKEHLSKSHSAKVVNKVQDCLGKIVIGLGENKRISTESLLIFTYGVVSESIDTLKMKMAKKELTEVEREVLRRKPADIFLIADEKSASRKKVVKTNVQTNTHILTEFGLNLLHTLLKSERVDGAQFEGFLNPLVPIFRETLGGVHVKLSTLTLKCLTVVWTRQLMQEAIKERTLEDFVGKILEILKRYSSTELTKNDENFHLVKNTFKAIMALLRFVQDFTITEDQLKEILLHVDRDLHARQAIAFPLLRAIVAQKLYVPEIDNIIEFVAELCVTSDSDTVREEARQILITYLLDYPLDGAKFKQHFMFFLSQLTYSESPGRRSVVQLIQNLFKKLSQESLKKNSGVVFLAMGARFVEDELPEIREQIARCLEEILRRLDDESRRELWEIVLSLFRDKMSSHAEMGAIMSVRFMNADKTFRKRLNNFLPLIVGKLSDDELDDNLPGKFVRVHMEEADVEDESAARAKDHKLIQILIAIGKFFDKFPDILMDDNLASVVDGLAFKCQEFLGYDHSWVRYYSAKILATIAGNIDVDLLTRRLADPDEDTELKREFLYRNPESHIRSLALDLCAQLQPEHIQENMVGEVMKILLNLAKFIKHREIVKREKDAEEEDTKRDGGINLMWIVRRLRYAANGEVTQAPHSTIIRTSIFHWIQGLVHMLDSSTLRLLARSLLTPLLREMSTENNNHDQTLSQLATKIVEKIKKKLNSDDEFTSLVNEIHVKQMQKRAERKKTIAMEKVVNPAKAAKRKASQQERKKVAKRRKMDVIKGKVAPKKRKTPPNPGNTAKKKRKKVK